MSTIPITASRYNALRILVNKILGDSVVSTPNYGYGQEVSTVAVTGDFGANDLATDKVTAEQYENLYIDLIRLRVHQVGVSATTIDPFVEGGIETNINADKIELAYMQALETLATNIETDRFLIDSATQASEVNLLTDLDVPISSTRSFSISSSWNGTITHIVKVTFDDAQQRRQFFNAGGEVRFNAAVDYTGSQAKTVDWQNQLSAMGTISFKANQTISNNGIGTSYSIGNYNLTNTYQLCYDQTSGAVYANNRYRINALQLNDTEIQFKIEFIDGAPNPGSTIDEAVLGDFISALKLLQPDGSVNINGVATDTVVIPTSKLPIGTNISLLDGLLTPTYIFNPSSPVSLNEGQSGTYTVNTTNVLNGTTLYWTIESVTGTVNTNDFTTAMSGSFGITNNTGSFTITTRADSTSEGPETFRIRLRIGSTLGSIVSSSSVVTINDTSVSATPPPPPPPPPPPSPTYSITGITNHPSSNNIISEGQYTATFTVTTNNVPNGTVLYWTTEGTSGNITADDFTDNTLTGSVTINNNTATFTRSARADQLTEGAEIFRIQLRTGSTSGTIVATSNTIGISDTSTTPTPPPPPSPTYSMTAVTDRPDFNNLLNEGQYTATFTVTTNNVPNGTTLYWTTDGTGITADDFTDNTLTGSVTINNNTATFTRSARADQLTEGFEVFIVRLHTGSTSGPIVAQDGIGISDTSLTPPPPTYSISITNPTTNVIPEGTSGTYTVTTTNVPNGTVLYWTITDILTNAADFTARSGSFTINSNTGTVIVGTVADQLTEGQESFTVHIRTGSTSGPSVASASTTIGDTSTTPTPPTYSITGVTDYPSGNTIIREGQYTATFTVTTTNVANGTTLYWTTEGTGITAADFTDFTLTGSVTINNNTATFTRSARADQLTEGPEVFRIRLRTGSTSGPVVASSGFIGIADTSTTP